MNFIMNIKEKSSLLHATAEKTGFIKRLADGNVTIDGYAEYLFNLEAMYKAIETALDNNESNETVKPFVTKELYRSDLIKKDLAFLVGDKIDTMSLLASTDACVSKINQLSENNPELVVAYAYTRFLADLFGGRTFNYLLNNKYNVPNEGLNYYQFPGIKDFKEYLMNYFNMLTNINLSDETKVDFINEVSNAYVYNIGVSNELESKLNK